MSTHTLDIFKSLRGQWQVRRALKSQPGYGFSGDLSGKATFTPRRPTAHSTALELLYFEEGELKTDNGLTLKANRKYIYRYSADDDKISVWFVKEETKDRKGQEEAEDLFMDVEVKEDNGTASGHGDHLCNMDMYWAEFVWKSNRIGDAESDEEDEVEFEMDVWGLRYKVKGPQKDYTSDTAYTRIKA